MDQNGPYNSSRWRSRLGEIDRRPSHSLCTQCFCVICRGMMPPVCRHTIGRHARANGTMSNEDIQYIRFERAEQHRGAQEFHAQLEGEIPAHGTIALTGSDEEIMEELVEVHGRGQGQGQAQGQGQGEGQGQGQGHMGRGAGTGAQAHEHMDMGRGTGAGGGAHGHRGRGTGTRHRGRGRDRDEEIMDELGEWTPHDTGSDGGVGGMSEDEEQATVDEEGVGGMCLELREELIEFKQQLMQVKGALDNVFYIHILYRSVHFRTPVCMYIHAHIIQ